MRRWLRAGAGYQGFTLGFTASKQLAS